MKLLLTLTTVLISQLASADEVLKMQCKRDDQRSQFDRPQYGNQLAFNLTIRAERNGSLTLKYINGSTYYAHQPRVQFCEEDDRTCMQQRYQEMQYSQQQVVAEETNLNFYMLIEVEDYILRTYCKGTWSSGLKR